MDCLLLDSCCFAFFSGHLTLIFYLKYLSIMSMKNKLSALLMANAIIGGFNEPNERVRLSTTPPNGNHRRKHTANLKRKKIRRISGKSRNLNNK